MSAYQHTFKHFYSLQMSAMMSVAVFSVVRNFYFTSFISRKPHVKGKCVALTVIAINSFVAWPRAHVVDTNHGVNFLLLAHMLPPNKAVLWNHMSNLCRWMFFFIMNEHYFSIIGLRLSVCFTFSVDLAQYSVVLKPSLCILKARLCFAPIYRQTRRPFLILIRWQVFWYCVYLPTGGL